MRSSHERLSQFFSGYFHEDWELEADDPSGIIDLYLSQQAAREQQIGVAADLCAHREFPPQSRALPPCPNADHRPSGSPTRSEKI